MARRAERHQAVELEVRAPWARLTMWWACRQVSTSRAMPISVVPPWSPAAPVYFKGQPTMSLLREGRRGRAIFRDFR